MPGPGVADEVVMPSGKRAVMISSGSLKEGKAIHTKRVFWFGSYGTAADAKPSVDHGSITKTQHIQRCGEWKRGMTARYSYKDYELMVKPAGRCERRGVCRYQGLE